MSILCVQFAVVADSSSLPGPSSTMKPSFDRLAAGCGTNLGLEAITINPIGDPGVEWRTAPRTSSGGRRAPITPGSSIGSHCAAPSVATKTSRVCKTRIAGARGMPHLRDDDAGARGRRPGRGRRPTLRETSRAERGAQGQHQPRLSSLGALRGGRSALAARQGSPQSDALHLQAGGGSRASRRRGRRWGQISLDSAPTPPALCQFSPPRQIGELSRVVAVDVRAHPKAYAHKDLPDDPGQPPDKRARHGSEVARRGNPPSRSRI